MARMWVALAVDVYGANSSANLPGILYMLCMAAATISNCGDGHKKAKLTDDDDVYGIGNEGPSKKKNSLNGVRIAVKKQRKPSLMLFMVAAMIALIIMVVAIVLVDTVVVVTTVVATVASEHLSSTLVTV